MDHDPLCPCFYKDTQTSPKWEERCVCDLLTAARVQEREKAAQRVEALMPERVITGGGIAYCDALREAAAAVRGES